MTEQQVLFDHILRVNDPQAAYLLLLMCGPDATTKTCGHAFAQFWGRPMLLQPLTFCHREHNLLSTGLWSLRFVVTGLPGQELLIMTGPHSRKLVIEKSARTPNRLGMRARLVLAAEVGGRKLMLLTCCEEGSSRPTSGGGVLCWHARPPSCASPRGDPFGEQVVREAL